MCEIHQPPKLNFTNVNIHEGGMAALQDGESMAATNIDGYRDPSSPELACFAKLDPNVSYARIRANGIIHYYVVRGDLALDADAFQEGSYVRVAAEQEFTPSTKGGCEILCIYTAGYDKIT